MRELRSVCERFGTVADVFIANKLSKAGKHFAFVRYIKVKNAQSIVEGLAQTRIGNQRFFANIARYERQVKPTAAFQNKRKFPVSGNSEKGIRKNGMTYASVLKGRSNLNSQHSIGESPITLDGDCMQVIEDARTVFACVKEFKSLINMKSICKNEGFHNVKLKYLGGFWISVEFQAPETCIKFQQHAGIRSWFSSILKSSEDLLIHDRVAWIDVEGIPVKAWTHQTFKKIASTWGDLIYTVDYAGTNRYSARLCIKTSIDKWIADSIKVSVNGRVSTVRVKEITGWMLDFFESSCIMEDEDKGDLEMPNDIDSHVENNNWESEEEEGEEDSYCNALEHHEDIEVRESKDPFDLTDLIKRTAPKRVAEESSGPIFPPGFTPLAGRESDSADVSPKKPPTYEEDEISILNSGQLNKSLDENTNALKEAQEVLSPSNGRRSTDVTEQYKQNCDEKCQDEPHDMGLNPFLIGETLSLSGDSVTKPRIAIEGFSMIEKFNEVVEFGHAMGFDMKGCEKDMKRIIASMGGNAGCK